MLNTLELEFFDVWGTIEDSLITAYLVYCLLASFCCSFYVSITGHWTGTDTANMSSFCYHVLPYISVLFHFSFRSGFDIVNFKWSRFQIWLLLGPGHIAQREDWMPMVIVVRWWAAVFKTIIFQKPFSDLGWVDGGGTCHLQERFVWWWSSDGERRQEDSWGIANTCYLTICVAVLNSCTISKWFISSTKFQEKISNAR